jgi:hypothetical protein
MKRKRVDVVVTCQDNTYETHLERMTHDLFRHVCSFLGFADLHALYRAVVFMQPVDRPVLAGGAAVAGCVLPYVAIPLLGGTPLHTELSVLASEVTALLTAECVRRLQQVASRDGTELLSLGYADVGSDPLCVYAYENAKVLANMKGALCDPCHYTRLLRCSELCTRCGNQFGVTTYWAYTADPQHLCNHCRLEFNSTRITDPNPQLPTNSGGWCWISASKLKTLCQVPSATKASVYAHAHGIRARSTVTTDAIVYGVRTPQLDRKEFYFYKDVLRHLALRG